MAERRLAYSTSRRFRSRRCTTGVPGSCRLPRVSTRRWIVWIRYAPAVRRANTQAGADMLTWMIGNTSVTRIEEQVGPNDLAAGAFLPDLVRERFERHLPWLVPVHYIPETDKLITSNHSWLIRTGRHTILLDSC